MHAGKLVFAQVMEFAPWRTFRRLVGEYRGDFNVRSFSCLDQFLCLAFAQLTYRESLRDIEACLCTQPAELYSLGPLGNVSRSALADTNEDRDWRIYYEVAQSLIRTARRLYAEGPIGVDISETVYALDPTTIDLCLALLPWARFRATKAAIKLHTLLDLLTPKPGAFFVTRAKSNSRFNRLLSRPVDRSTGLICDLCVELVVFYSHQGYSERLRRIVCRDPERDKRLVFLRNHVSLPALTVCALYKSRGQVELFFKWIKQHLRIKRFLDTSENAVRTQIWCAVATYVLIAIVKKKVPLDALLYTCLQILSVSVFEKTEVSCALQPDGSQSDPPIATNQLILFDFYRTLLCDNLFSFVANLLFPLRVFAFSSRPKG